MKNGYLKKYVGTYRVKAKYDLDLLDFPRNDDGTIDDSFDDYYIPCKNDVEIKHATGKEFSCYVPSLQRGNNILRKIYESKVEKINENSPLSVAYIRQLLCDKNILLSIEDLDSEVYFTFKEADMDFIASLVGASTYGAKIQPLSVKNLPRTPYKIPDKDLKTYKDIIDNSNLPKVKMKAKNGKEREMVSGLIINSLIQGFDAEIKRLKKYSSVDEVKADKKKKALRGKEYIHSEGLWKGFIGYLEKEIEAYGKNE